MPDRCPRCTAAGPIPNADARRCQFRRSSIPSTSPVVLRNAGGRPELYWRSRRGGSWNCDTINYLRELASSRLVWNDGGQWCLTLPVSDLHEPDFLIVSGYQRRGGITALWSFYDEAPPDLPTLDVVEDVIAGLERERKRLALAQPIPTVISWQDMRPVGDCGCATVSDGEGVRMALCEEHLAGARKMGLLPDEKETP